MRVLIVKLSSLGDVIQTLPVVHDLLAHARPVEIDWVVEEAFAPLLGVVLGIDRVVPYAGRRWRRQCFAAATRRERRAFEADLRRDAYDAVIDFQGLIKSALVARRARLTSDGHRYTYANGSELCGYEWPVRYLVDRPIPMERRVHAVRRYRLLAARSLGYSIADGEGEGDAARESVPRVNWRFASPAAATRDVVLAHGTTRSDNEWPEPCWADIGQRLVAAGFRVVLPRSGPWTSTETGPSMGPMRMPSRRRTATSRPIWTATATWAARIWVSCWRAGAEAAAPPTSTAMAPSTARIWASCSPTGADALHAAPLLGLKA